MEDDNLVPITFQADTSNLRLAMSDAEKMAMGFGRAMTSAFTSAVVGGKSLGDVLRNLGLRLSEIALKAAMKPLEQAIGGLFSNIMSSVTPFAKGGVVSPQVTAFASGGVVAAPTYFPMRGGRLGLMGEAGAEAIMPLTRGSDGKLGVRIQGGSAAPNVTVNISTPDVQGFRRSEATVAASLARAVARGRRGL